MQLSAHDSPLEIACDEAGHTGPNLLQADQRHFAFASVATTDQEAWAIIEQARKLYPVQMSELKASKLITSTVGKALLSHVLEAIDGRFVLTVHNKLVALGAHVFEYIFEPVFKDDPSLLYAKDFHRFIAMLCYVWFTARASDADEGMREFQAYLRTLNEAADDPSLPLGTTTPSSRGVLRHQQTTACNGEYNLSRPGKIPSTHDGLQGPARFSIG